ncbi:hypothetical protein R1flu_000143 [Riccia fluitans]|uniref:Uncharacterized protein n=1 Tax=Riccia fluitans TaxID=41844 RepID=A0ABD1XZS3_9MARC
MLPACPRSGEMRSERNGQDHLAKVKWRRVISNGLRTLPKVTFCLPAWHELRGYRSPGTRPGSTESTVRG